MTSTLDSLALLRRRRAGMQDGMPRLPLAGQRRADVIAMVEKCAATRPTLKAKAA